MTRKELEQEVRATEREILVAKRYGRNDMAERATAKLAELAEIGLEMDHDNMEEETTMTNTKTLWGGYYYETDGQTYWKAGENWDTERVEISEAEYNEAMADRQDYYDHRDIYDNDEQLLWDIEMEAAIEEETGNPMTSEVETESA